MALTEIGYIEKHGKVKHASPQRHFTWSEIAYLRHSALGPLALPVVCLRFSPGISKKSANVKYWFLLLSIYPKK